MATPISTVLSGFDEKKTSLQSSSLSESPIPDSDFVEIDPEAERRLIRKMDWILLPLFTAIFCCNFIDRTSVGNARVAGLEKDLKLEKYDLNKALTVFYICYMLSDLPSNLMLKKYGSIWLAFLVAGFGIVSLTSAFMQNAAGLYITRVFLGLTEGGTFRESREDDMEGYMEIVQRYKGNYSTVEVQLRTVPPYLASAVWAIINAYISARMKKRYPPLLFNSFLVILGYIINVTTKNGDARYAACFLIIVGASVCGPMLMTWATDNAAPDPVRVVVTGILPGLGAIGPIIGVWTYVPGDAPDYRKGNIANLATSSMVFVVLIGTALYIRWENARRERGYRDYRLLNRSEEEIRKLGYLHPHFKLQI